jgi:predicted transcriptional regulator
MKNGAAAASLLECDSCGNLGIGEGEVVCCDQPMSRVGGDQDGVSEPSIEHLMQTVFGMSESELDICLCVMAAGEQTVSDLAATVDYDRSVVSRHLNHLADLGVVEKQRRLLKQGGHVYVYAPTEPATVRRSLKGAFLTWAQEAVTRIDSLSKDKVAAMVESEAETPQWKIYQE